MFLRPLLHHLTALRNSFACHQDSPIPQGRNPFARAVTIPCPGNCWTPFPAWGQEIWCHMWYDTSGYMYEGVSASFKKISRSCLQRHLALSQARPIRGSSQYSTSWEGSSLSLLIHLSCLQMPQSCEWPPWSLRDRWNDPNTKQLFPLRLAMFPLPGHPKPVAYFNPWILLFISVWTHSVFPSRTRSFQGSCSTRLACPAALLSLHHGTSPPPAPGWPGALHRNTQEIYCSP